MQLTTLLRSSAVSFALGAVLVLPGCSNADKAPSANKTSANKKSEETRSTSGKLEAGSVNRGVIAKIINASGVVRPDITVEVGSEVSGKILSVEVDFNSVVTKGDVLAVIDPENLENRVAQVEAQVENRRADINISTASLKRAEVNSAQANRSLERRKKLYAENAISQAQLEETERAMELASSDIELAKARLEGAQSALRQSLADLRSVRVNLSRSSIIAPIDGVVIERLVDPGQTVAASFSAPELFKIAGDLSKIKIDAYTAVVDAENLDKSLMPGMTANLQITTNSKSGILRIPASAERFRPTPDQIKTWKAEEKVAGSSDVDPKTRERLTALGLSDSRADTVLDTMANQTENLREQIADPTQTWRKVARLKQLRETYDGIIKKELTSTEYQEYRRLLQADAQTRDAQLWVKSGDKMRQVNVGLGLSDGSFVEVLSGLTEEDEVVVSIKGNDNGGQKGRPVRR